jgi:hypothetical protein
MGAPTYFVVDYDNLASGSFSALGADLTWDAAASSGFIVTALENLDGLTGKLYCALLTGTLPDNNDTMTQGSVTADAVEDGALIAYPAYARRDLAVAGSGAITWDATAPDLGSTHSFKFDGQSTNCSANDILTFSGGQTAELIEIESDVGATGEYNVRFIGPLDTIGLPDDNETFTASPSGGDGTVDGQVHTRAYSPLDVHRMLMDLNDDEDIFDDDDLSRVDPTPSERSTDEIVDLLGTVNVSADVIKHMYGGSLTQASGDELISGLDVQVTSPVATTQPVIIQDDAIITDYWGNAYMPDSIKGSVRIMLKTRHDGVDIDGRRVKGKLTEFNNLYFTGGTTLGTASTALALFSSPDANNQTAVGTVAGAPYNTIVLTEGYQELDHNNGNGPQPFALSLAFGSANSLQAYERTKYIQRRGTAETLFGRDATFFDGVNLNFAYDNLTGAFSEDEIVYWGTEVTYTGQSTNFTVEDDGATGTCIFDMGGNTLPGTSKSMLGLDSGGDGTTNTVGTNTAAGSGTLIADDATDDDLYISRLTGILPVNNSEIWGGTSNADCLVDGTPESRTINNQFIGNYTGTNDACNFGISVAVANALLGDSYPDLDGGVQGPPDNQNGVVTGGKKWDTITCYPWDGSSLDINNDPEPDYDEMALATALVAATSTQVDVGSGNIPDNTPQLGWLRVERDSDGNMDLIEYDSHDGDRYFEIVGTAPSNAAISNDVMRAPIDEELTADGDVSFQAVKGAGSTQYVITVRNGYTALRNGPIKVAKATATFGATGFEVPISRISDG